MASRTANRPEHVMLAAAREDYIHHLETLVVPNFIRILYNSFFGFMLGFQVFDLLELDRKTIEIDAETQATIVKLIPIIEDLAVYDAANAKWALRPEIKENIDKQGGLPKSDFQLLRALREWTQASKQNRQRAKTSEESGEQWRELITWIKTEVHQIVLKRLGEGDLAKGEMAVGLEEAFYVARKERVDEDGKLVHCDQRQPQFGSRRTNQF